MIILILRIAQYRYPSHSHDQERRHFQVLHLDTEVLKQTRGRLESVLRSCDTSFESSSNTISTHSSLPQPASYSNVTTAPSTITKIVPPSTAPLTDRPTACPVKLNGVGVAGIVVLIFVKLPTPVEFAV